MIIEMERMWKEAEDMAYFNILAWNLPGGTEEDNKKLRIASHQAKI
jgi:hypothetical protein